MSLAALVRRSVGLTCLYYMADDALAGRRLRAGRLDTDSGVRHAGLDLDTSLAYIERVYRDYLAYGGRERLTGVVAEIGPGDSYGVAALMLADGAQEVHAVDRYRPRRDPARQAAIYRALADRHAIARVFDGEPGEHTLRGLVAHVGVAAEDFFRGRSGAFEAIVSRAVMEHLFDPIGALDGMLAALKPGGILIHRIDLRDHGMFAGHHPLTFLTIAGGIYSAMTRRSGRPNRVLLPAYREWLARSWARGSIAVSRLAGVAQEVGPALWADLPPVQCDAALACVRAIRPRLVGPFAAMSDEDLAVAGIVLVARKSA